MRSASIVSSVSAVIIAGVFFACANGGDLATGDDGTGTGTDTDSGVGTTPVTDVDSGNGGFVAPKDAGTEKKDSGSTGGGTDSGSGGGTDSGSTGGGTNDDCTGTQSAGLMESYSSACTQSLGAYNWGSCTSGNGDCAALTAMNPQLPGPLCCYTPKSNSACDILYGPSCLPK